MNPIPLHGKIGARPIFIEVEGEVVPLVLDVYLTITVVEVQQCNGPKIALLPPCQVPPSAMLFMQRKLWGAFDGAP